MDPLTHALSGALLARAAAPAKQRQCSHPHGTPRLPVRLQVATGFAAAAFPDIDFALRLIDTLTYLNWHQGPTHSLLMLPLWALLIAYLCAWLFREYSWRQFFLPACLGLAIHIAGDLITSYGLMLFAPLSTERYSLSLAFVIDPWFSLIIIAGLLASWFYPDKKTAAIVALTGLTGYVFFLWMLHSHAVGIANTYARTLPHARISVLPQPLSPFHWKIIIRQNENYHIARVNLIKKDDPRQNDADLWLLPQMAAAYRPVSEKSWQLLNQFGTDSAHASDIRQAWLHPAFEPFRTFAQFPLLERIDQADDALCYWFYDLRFKFPVLPPSFIFGICRQNNESDWQMMRHRGLFYID
ncbi:MAG: metal-dependent hydrolase [Burkholderiales bacterium]|nr:metal-dependent hydrolase [Burkholderiales bacterium]MDR4516117.1 metal-dependent hydrolase [Nitrosomonas sp.]